MFQGVSDQINELACNCSCMIVLRLYRSCSLNQLLFQTNCEHVTFLSVLYKCSAGELHENSLLLRCISPSSVGGFFLFINIGKILLNCLVKCLPGPAILVERHKHVIGCLPCDDTSTYNYISYKFIFKCKILWTFGIDKTDISCWICNYYSRKSTKVWSWNL